MRRFPRSGSDRMGLPGAVYTCQYRSHAHLASGFEASPMATVLPFERPFLGQA